VPSISTRWLLAKFNSSRSSTCWSWSPSYSPLRDSWLCTTSWCLASRSAFSFFNKSSIFLNSPSFSFISCIFFLAKPSENNFNLLCCCSLATTSPSIAANREFRSSTRSSAAFFSSANCCDSFKSSETRRSSNPLAFSPLSSLPTASCVTLTISACKFPITSTECFFSTSKASFSSLTPSKTRHSSFILTIWSSFSPIFPCKPSKSPKASLSFWSNFCLSTSCSANFWLNSSVFSCFSCNINS